MSNLKPTTARPRDVTVSENKKSYLPVTYLTLKHRQIPPVVRERIIIFYLDSLTRDIRVFNAQRRPTALSPRRLLYFFFLEENWPLERHDEGELAGIVLLA